MGRIVGQVDLLPVVLAQELLLVGTVLGEAPFGDDDLVIIR